MNAEQLWDMRLHEQARILGSQVDLTVVRVPGGWIYKNRVSQSSFVFVPLNNEFNEVSTTKHNTSKE